MKKIYIALSLILITLTAFNQTIVEKTIKLNSQKEVVLDFDFADEIKIKGWDKNEIYVKVSVNINDNEDNGAFKLDTKESSSFVSFISDIENMKKISKNRITVKTTEDGKRTTTYSDGWHIDMDIYFEVFLPKNMNVNLGTISGDVILSDAIGELNIETISGFIDLTIDKVAKASLKTSTISGGVYTDHDIEINRKARNGKYHMVIGSSPDFDINGGGRSINLKTISGDIYIRK
ncbi:MAG: hypothetical protein KKG99_16890 [Bacteroidetes bacterium]|nr:hypothetical protein [Bacteroidota bacterium]